MDTIVVRPTDMDERPKQNGTSPDCVWNANPYPGRLLIRKLWLNQGLPEGYALIRDNRLAFVDAFFQVVSYVRSDLTEGRRHAWAAERYEARLGEVARSSGSGGVS